MDEEWRPISNCPDFYEVSNFGRVRSAERTKLFRHPVSGKIFTRRYKSKLLSPATVKSGHQSVVIGRKYGSAQIHRLVLQEFLGPCPLDMEVRHWDGNPGNNRLDNLVYGTRKENILDVYDTHEAWRKLSAAQVREIRQMLAEGIRGARIAEKFGISQTTVSSIKLGGTYSWLP